MKKGSKLYIEGQLQTRKWQNKVGQDQYSTEVVLQGFGSTLTMLDGARGGSVGGGMQESGQADYDGGRDSGGSGGSSMGGGGFDDAPPKRAPARSSGGGDGSKGSFDKKIDDEIPF